MPDRALLCGINNYESVGDLRGCLNDVEDMKRLLVETFGFDAKNVRTLLDQRVKKSELERHLRWLAADAKAGDRRVFHFAGHGSHVLDTSGDEGGEEGEGGGVDECLCLHDMDFAEPDSYLTDDDLGAWAKGVPAGVQLVLILDNCESGTGTRMIAPAASGSTRGGAAKGGPAIDVTSTLRRAGTGSRAAELAEVLLDPEGDRVVLDRYVVPPPAVQAKLRAKRRGARAVLGRAVVETPGSNHLLLAACKDTQTAADARIGDEFRGAFTYHLCKAIREAGVDVSRRTLEDRVGRALREEGFEQLPQFETSDADTPLFAEAKPHAPTPTPDMAEGGDARGRALDLLERIVSGGSGLSADERSRALGVLERLVPEIGGRRDGTPSSTPRAGQRVLVYVHGICKHDPGFSDRWWDALRPHTSAFGDGRLGEARREVVWSHVVNRGLRATRAASAEEEALAAELRGALLERAEVEIVEAAPRVASAALAERSTAGDGPSPRDVFTGDLASSRGLSIPGLSCVDDFARYMLSDATRAAILHEFTTVVRPLLQWGAEVDVVSHSWGTVVAYEGLRELEDEGLTAPRVRNWFTVGAALAIGTVKRRLRRQNRDGRRPAMVRRWVNLDAKGDPVGGEIMARPFAVDFEYVDLPNLGCKWHDMSCAHASYFRAENVEVNRDVFAHFIDRG